MLSNFTNLTTTTYEESVDFHFNATMTSTSLYGLDSFKVRVIVSFANYDQYKQSITIFKGDECISYVFTKKQVYLIHRYLESEMNKVSWAYIKQPSKYHTLYLVGKSTEGADRSGRRYHWDTRHKELEPTHVFYADKYERHAFCSYCGESALPIQNSHYTVTGHTCYCDGAEAELLYRKEAKELRQKQQEEQWELQKKYQDRLSFDTDRQINIKMKYKKSELESDLRHNRLPNFKELEGIKERLY